MDFFTIGLRAAMSGLSRHYAFKSRGGVIHRVSGLQKAQPSFGSAGESLSHRGSRCRELWRSTGPAERLHPRGAHVRLGSEGLSLTADGCCASAVALLLLRSSRWRWSAALLTDGAAC